MIARRAPWTAVAFSMLVLPLAVLGLSAPLWVGVLAAAATLFAGALLTRAPRMRIASAKPTVGALDEAEAAHAELFAAGHDVRDLAVRACVRRMAERSRALIDHVASTPGDLTRVQRALTYYLPRAAALAGSYAVMEDVGERARLPEVARVLLRLEAYLDRALDWVAGDARRALDIELKLIDDALDEDDPAGRRREQKD